MIPLKNLKIADLTVQLLAALLPLFYFLFMRGEGNSDNFYLLINGYYILGTCQVLSAVANRVVLPKEYRAPMRGWYELALLLLLAMGVIAFFMKALLLVGIILLYVSPVLAIAYLSITIAELVTTIKKPTEI